MALLLKLREVFAGQDTLFGIGWQAICQATVDTGLNHSTFK